MNVTLIIAIASLIIFLGFLGDFAFRKLRFPDILVLIFIGYLIVFLFKTDEYKILNEYIPLAATISLIIILFEGGLTLDLSKTKEILKDSLLMAIAFYTVSFTLIYTVLYFIGTAPIFSLLYASILSAPSVAIVIPMINRSNVDENRRHKYIMYATLLDLISIVITISIIQFYPITINNFLKVIASLISSIILQIFIGALAGILWTEILKKIGNMDLSYMLTLAYVLAIYVFSDILWNNGMISVITIGLVLANSEKIRNIVGMEVFAIDENLKRFNREVSFFFRTIIFVSIGTMLYIAKINIHIIIILITIISIIYIVQILTVKFVENQKLYRHIHYIMPRGLTQIVLGIFAVSSPYGNIEILYIITFVIIITNIITSLFIYLAKLNSVLRKK